MEPPGGRDTRYNLNYGMNLLSGETPPEIYGAPGLGRPSTSLQQLSPRMGTCGPRGLKGDVCYDDRGMSSQNMGGLEACNDMSSEDAYGSMQPKKSPPGNGKKTKGRVKIKMEYIENKLRRYTTFSKRKTGIMKKVSYYNLFSVVGTDVRTCARVGDVAASMGFLWMLGARNLLLQKRFNKKKNK